MGINGLLIAAVLPSIVLGTFIYKKDVFGKEPPGLLTKLFFGGVLATMMVIFFGGILSDLLPILDPDESNSYFELFIAVFLGIALIEEFCKWVNLKRITWNNKEYDHIYDAIVYAVFVSLGFATVENIMYVLDGGIGVAILRAIASVPGHAFDGVFMGYHYGISKQAQLNGNMKLMKKEMALSLIVPTIAHGTFDFLLFTNSGLCICIWIIFVISLYIVSFIKVNQLAKVSVNFRNGTMPVQIYNNTVTTNSNGYVTVNNSAINAQPVQNNSINSNFCPNCGRKNEGTIYCPGCGHKF